MGDVRETELDLGALAAALWRHAWILGLVTVVAAILAYVLLSAVEPLYTADTRILIEDRESPLTRPRDAAAVTAERYDESAIQSRVEVLRSRDIATTVIDRLDLTHRPEFEPAAKPSLVDSILIAVGMKRPAPAAATRERVMDTYFARLSVYPIDKSRVIGVDFEAPNAQLAADVANAIAEAFVDLQQKAEQESSMAATAWLEREIDRLRGRVEQAEADVAAYQSSEGLFDTSSNAAGTTSLSSQQLTDLNAELSRAKAARAEAQSRAALVREVLANGGSLETSQEVLNSPLMQRLRERQVALRSEIAQLSTSLLPGHPRIAALQTELGNLNRQVRDEAQKILQSLETAARVAQAREDSLVKDLNTAKAAVASSNEKEIRLRALEREARAQRDLLETFLGRYREAVARSDAEYVPVDARIISRAVPPRKPSWPKKGLLTVVVGLAVLLLGATAILVREFTSGRAFRIIAGEPLAIPDALGEPARPAEPPSVFGSAARLAARERPGTAELAEVLVQPGVRTVLFAGLAGGEGAGEIAVAAARLAARENVRPIILDIGVPGSPALRGEGPGLGELLAGNAAFGEVIRRDDTSRVHYIAIGATDEDPPLQRLTLVVAALAHTYDKVIVVADSLEDWPNEHVRPDLAAVLCRAGVSEAERRRAYQDVLERGARSAILVRLEDGVEAEPETVAA
ncbi:GumC family protein [Propylenella binzhouense]|uniref:Chain-length determining protein n=1 Tax=Propylenella binzhouense TaxID=2555902 RepID=A0A964WTX1_9HYPH|nr:exopolysaccharide transport family protein [Propylenella binzhouense]MYZ48487.1 chain-length determining protein [Propylenella binzhouense]